MSSATATVPVKVMKCDPCKPHEFQDTTLGLKNRVFNLCKSASSIKYRCTVCAKETERVSSNSSGNASKK